MNHAARVAVVFNASWPLAQALAMEFALQGFSLALCDCDPVALEPLVDLCFDAVKISPFKVSAFECMVEDESSVQACAGEVLAEFGRVDVICFVDQRWEEPGMAAYASVWDAQHRLGMRVLGDDEFDFTHVVNAFYPLLKMDKPKREQLLPQLFGSNMASRRGQTISASLHDDVEDDDEEDEKDLKSTALLLFVSTPDSCVCRAGRSRYVARARAIEVLVKAINAEAIFRGERVRACTAIVGTLHGEVPFWQSREREDTFRHILEREQVAKTASLQQQQQQQHTPVLARTTPSNSLSNLQSIFSKHLIKRRASRSRGLALTEQGEQEEDVTLPPPPPPAIPRPSSIRLLTSESLSCEEASAWIIWGLVRGRYRIVVGYDVLLLESAWLPNAFLNRLFAFAGAGGRRNLLPTRHHDNTQAATKYDLDRLWRHRTRQAIVFAAFVFALFTPVVAVIIISAAALWSYAVLSKEGHTVTERAVSTLLFAVSLRRRPWVEKSFAAYRRVERTIMLAMARAEDALARCRRTTKRRRQ